MACDLEATPLEDQTVWRIGRAPTPWRFTDWAHADQHGRFRPPDGSVAASVFSAWSSQFRGV